MDKDTPIIAPAKAAFWNNPTYRALLFQAVILSAVLFFGYTIYGNTVANLERQGIASGFDFLDSTAGFGIITHLVEYSEESSYGRAFLVGLLNTLLIAFLGIILATILGVLIGVARLSSNWVISKMAMVYIETFRNIPLLLQIFFWYFAVLRALPHPRSSVNLNDTFFLNNRGFYSPMPLFGEGGSLIGYALIAAIIGVVVLSRWSRKRQERSGEQFPVFLTSVGLLVGLPLLAAAVVGFPLTWEYPALKGFNFVGGLVMIPEFVAMLFALSIYTASFIAEIVRAGIESVSHGQTEAARALGLRSGPTLRLIILPQALRVIIPPLTSQYLNLTKNSSLAAAIAYPELVSVFAGTVLNQTGQAIEVITITMGVYLTISLLISLFMNWYNARISLVER
ncbi:MAG: amino acid ABC transporter permease [Sedimenticola sp.]